MIRHASIGFAVLAAALSLASPSLAYDAKSESALKPLDQLLAQKCGAFSKSDCARNGSTKAQSDGTSRVRFFEELRGRPDSLKIPQNARRDATAGVFI